MKIKTITFTVTVAKIIEGTISEEEIAKELLETEQRMNRSSIMRFHLKDPFKKERKIKS